MNFLSKSDKNEEELILEMVKLKLKEARNKRANIEQGI